MMIIVVTVALALGVTVTVANAHSYYVSYHFCYTLQGLSREETGTVALPPPPLHFL